MLDYCFSGTNTACDNATASNNGNLLGQRIRTGTLDLRQAYSYDSLNRLTGASESGGGTAWSQTYAYDRFGNRAVTGTASYRPQATLTPQALTSFDTATNRLTGGTVTVLHDSTGNLTRDWGGRTYQYDGDNRLVTFNTGAAGATDATYHYDGEGRRVKRVAGGVTTVYVYDVFGKLLAEYSSPGPTASKVSYLTGDHLGSIRMVTDGSGNVVTRHDYLPFGEEIGSTYGGRSSITGYTSGLTSGPAQRFTSKERDTESGLDFFGARYYGGPFGRFTSADMPLVDQYSENPQSWNLYSYVRNNPLRFIDPRGNKCVSLDGSGQGDDGLPGEPCPESVGVDTALEIMVEHQVWRPSPYFEAVAEGMQLASGPVHYAFGATMGFVSTATPVPLIGAFARVAGRLWKAGRNLSRGKNVSGERGTFHYTKM